MVREWFEEADMSDLELAEHVAALTAFGTKKPTMREVFAYVDRNNLNCRAQAPTNKATWARKRRRPL